jgi:hypothetical protein
MNNWTIVGILTIGALVFLMLFAWITVRKEGGRRGAAAAMENWLDSRAAKRRFNRLLQSAYVRLIRVPVLRIYIRKIRKRLEILHAHDEYAIRRETMRISLITIGLTLLAVLALIWLTDGWLSYLWILLATVTANGILVDTFVNRAEDRLLKQSVLLLEDTRHHFQQTKNVEEAVYEAAQTAPHDAGKHGERVYEVLTAENQEEALETYYEVAPNRYFRLFAGISYLVSEYGDRYVKTGSMYLSSLAKLVQEINYEILRRDKLNYLLKGLAAIAIAPVLVMSPLEKWAETYFPIMSDFYESKTGIIIKVVFFAVVLISYLLIRKMLEHDEARYSAKNKRLNWEKFLYERRPIAMLVNRMVPPPFKRLHFQISMLIKQANSPLTLEWLYVQRLAAAVCSFVLVIGLAVYLHVNVVQATLHNPLQGMGMFGQLSEEDVQLAEERAAFDREMIRQLQQQEKVTHQGIIELVSRQTEQDASELTVIQSAKRILAKYNVISNEYFKWWELLLAAAVSVIAYQLPVWMLQFQRKMRQIEMQNEVDQFHTMISILAEFERISVETIMEWMERFSIIFQDSIKNGLNNYSGGPSEALETMKDESPFIPFVRIIEKLQLSIEKIPVKDAFDDLEMAREYYLEKRKEHNARVIEQKAAFGKIVGFVPFGYIVFLDLVLPMLYLSVVEMGNSMRTISGV